MLTSESYLIYALLECKKDYTNLNEFYLNEEEGFTKALSQTIMY